MSSRVLCFGAHPDDIEFGCGATIAKLVQAGANVTFVVMTSGEAGDAKIPPEELGKIREQEAVHAAKVLGVSDVRFMHLRDGLTETTFDQKIAVINLIRELKPDTVFTHASSDVFSDHNHIHKLVIASISAAAGPWFQQAKGEPHAVKHIYGFEVWHPLNTYQMAVDVSATMALKLAALAEHKSQTAGISYDRAAGGLASYRGTMTFLGAYAEVFEVIKTQLGN